MFSKENTHLQSGHSGRLSILATIHSLQKRWPFMHWRGIVRSCRQIPQVSSFARSWSTTNCSQCGVTQSGADALVPASGAARRARDWFGRKNGTGLKLKTGANDLIFGSGRGGACSAALAASPKSSLSLRASSLRMNPEKKIKSMKISRPRHHYVCSFSARALRLDGSKRKGREHKGR